MDAQTFEAVQERLRLNKQQATRNNHNPEATLLRGGYVRCGYCESPKDVHPHQHGLRCMCKRTSRGQGWGKCSGHSIMAAKLDAEVWHGISHALADRGLIARQLAEGHKQDPAAADLAAVDRALAEVTRKQRTLVGNLALVSGTAAALVAEQLQELGNRAQRLTAEHETLLRRQQAWWATEDQLAELEQ